MDVVRDGIRIGQGVLAGMRWSVRAGFGARLQLTVDHHHAHGVSTSSHVDLEVGSVGGARKLGRCSRQRRGTGGRGGQRGHGRWGSACTGGRGEQPWCEIRLEQIIVLFGGVYIYNFRLDQGVERTSVLPVFTAAEFTAIEFSNFEGKYGALIGAPPRAQIR